VLARNRSKLGLIGDSPLFRLSLFLPKWIGSFNSNLFHKEANRMKKTVDEIKGHKDDIKHSMDEVKSDIQVTQDGAKDTAFQSLWHRENTDTPDQLEPEFDKEGSGFIVRIGGSLAGEITYTPIDEHTWVLDHTFVSPQYRGRDVAQRLLQLVAAEARGKGKKIIPACSYAAVQFRRHSEYADVWKQT
jgi:predicted GNAT family acetyltransferase